MTQSNTLHTKKGFTLAELVIYMGILSILLVLFINMFGLLMDRQLETQSESGLQQDSQYLLLKIGYEFGRAKSVQFPTQLGTPSATLQLEIDSVATSYYLNAGNFFASHSGSIFQLNSPETSISNLSFRRLGAGNSYDVIQVQCDIASRTKKLSGYDVNHFSTTLGIREK